MNKSLRMELRKISVMIAVAVLILLGVFSYLDYRSKQIFNHVIGKNNLLNEMYRNMESMEENLALYLRTAEKVYFDSYIYFGERLYLYLEKIHSESFEKKYVQHFVEKMRKFNDIQLREIREMPQENEERLTKVYWNLNDMIAYTKAWIMKDLEMNTKEYQSQMEGISALQYIILFYIFIFIVIGYIDLSQKFIRIRNAIKGYQGNAQALSERRWDISDMLPSSYEELDELGKAMNHMKHEIRSYIVQMEKKNQLEAELREEKLVNEKKDRALVESKLRELHAKIDPHFLFNALNLVGKYALLEEPEKAMEIIEGISKILRYSMETTEQFTTLATELDIVDTYIFVQKCRFFDKIEYCREIENGLEHIKIPAMTLQPLVENCFKHGLKDLDRIRISIRVFSGERGVEMEIYDNGNGIKDLENVMNRGIGLKGVAERLTLLYHQTDLLKVESQKGKYTKISIRIPKEVLQ